MFLVSWRQSFLLYQRNEFKRLRERKKRENPGACPAGDLLKLSCQDSAGARTLRKRENDSFCVPRVHVEFQGWFAAPF